MNPSYDEHSEEFIHLWTQGILQQKDLNVVWNLGFRGQGDQVPVDESKVGDLGWVKAYDGNIYILPRRQHGFNRKRPP